MDLTGVLYQNPSRTENNLPDGKASFYAAGQPIRDILVTALKWATVGQF